MITLSYIFYVTAFTLRKTIVNIKLTALAAGFLSEIPLWFKTSPLLQPQASLRALRMKTAIGYAALCPRQSLSLSVSPQAG
jgi:hypothetical protein